MLRLTFTEPEPKPNSCRIDNPLIHKTIVQIRREARELAVLIGLPAQEDLFARGGEVARDPDNFNRVKDLTETEREALKGEKKTTLLSQPKALQVTVWLLSLSALTQGWVESASNAGNLIWPRQLGIEDRLWLVAICNAIPFLAGGICALLFADPCMAFGRRGVLFISGWLCVIGAIGASASNDWKQLISFRTILGLGLGAKASMTAVFAAEISPSHLRYVVCHT